MFSRLPFGFAAVALAITIANALSSPPPMSSDEIHIPPSTRMSPLDAPATALRTGPLAPVASTPFPRFFSHRFGDAGQRSRGFASAAAGRWRVARETTLFPETGTRGLLATPDRVVVLGEVWQVFDSNGRPIVDGLAGPGNAALSAEGDALLVIDSTGAFQRYRLDTGALEFYVGAGRGLTVFYSLLGARGTEHWVAGVERALDPHGLHRPSFGYLMSLRCPEPCEVDPNGRLLRAVDEQEWELPEPVLLGAIDGETLVFSRPGQVFVANFGLSTLRSWSGAFRPRAMSADDGTLHLVVESERGPRYWRVSPQGILMLDLPLGAERVRDVPPVVDLQGRSFIRTARGYMVVDANGGNRVSVPVRTAAPWLVAQPDGSLLLADGPELVRLDESLRAMTLLRLEGEVFAGPPIARASGEIVAATATRLLTLERIP